ncbi:helicase RepA family protein [Proteus mirabilis]|uniref:helicase RepA family protein n=1 Tax=Proteus mirabilis TaxID=584 RepID=UPI0023F8B7F1|nr:helicase RepA family protein [Proteus mirabilis]MDF7456578.1 helicase RepA family protein [Proteus mirabilis]
MSEFMENFSWLDLRHAVEHEPAPLDFVLPGFKSGTVGALVSPGATGKTMLALQAAITVSGGPDMLDFSGMDTAWQRTAGRVVFLTGEDPSDVLNGRFYSIGERLKEIEKETVFTNLHVAPLVGCGVDVMTIEWRRWLANVTRDARLVIFDTLRRFHKLDENDGGHMAGLLAYMEQLCRENSTTVLFLHHTSKAGALNSGDAQQASRGSSVLTDNSRFQANLIGMTLEQAKQFNIDESCRRNFVRLSFPKINYSAPIEDRWFRRGPGGVLEPAQLLYGGPSKSTMKEKYGKPRLSKVVGVGGENDW